MATKTQTCPFCNGINEPFNWLSAQVHIDRAVQFIGDATDLIAAMAGKDDETSDRQRQMALARLTTAVKHLAALPRA